MKSIYIIQPYRVGSKNAESLALIIPSKVRKQANIDTSTVFTLRIDENTKRITLQTINDLIEKYENTVPTGESLVASNQQVPVKIQ
jgi:hypothetical protein